MLHNIGNLNKVRLLMELHANALASNWTKKTLSNIPFFNKYNLKLTEKNAQKLLKNNPEFNFDYIGPVLFKTSSSGTAIDTTLYDKKHHGLGGAQPAGEIIAKLRAEYSDKEQCNLNVTSYKPD
ncbi:hypothetical protein ACFORL_10840 [Legionella dresdenensis]|uniref:Uncharacterized protein n=1 Tax=Legionella dresdenensis TaxID=450200 RepID=A0ABV8CGW8_9GAMM